ncbi:NYN domain-containing protein [Nocardioides sp.]|uniref:NYN domain-containing protein n=1 Tax=Nocardioides sp. TaxID=35761 RepID=UPI00271DBD84|nr:NYN domain-containing protein [Nocardioides sp.]MDO9456852.1 NYN domain-containing protein [Nocardioides sp.]
MTSTPEPALRPDVRLGVLIDADNTSGAHAGAILEELATYGVPTVKRAYGDWTTQHLVGWKDALLAHAIQPMQQFANTRGKNSTDSALIIDAMDLLYGGNLDAFALVSSDSDFTRLATRLREAGKLVVGLGRRTTPPALIAACDRFVFLEVITGTPTETLPDEPGAEVTELPALGPILQSAIDSTSGDDGWAHLSAVATHIQKRHASFDPRNYGSKKLVDLVRAQPKVEVSQSANVVRVRLATTRKTAAKHA